MKNISVLGNQAVYGSAVASAPEGRTSGTLLFGPQSTTINNRNKQAVRLGFIRDLPDFRDQTLSTIQQDEDNHFQTLVKELRKSSSSRSFMLSPADTELPVEQDLTQSGDFTLIEDQGQLGSCTANAVIGMVEYLIKRSSKRTEDFSRLFLYKATRNLMCVTGDTGATIRNTIKALRIFGVPAARYWPYEELHYDVEPNAFAYSMAANFKAIQYFRLDHSDSTGEANLHSIKQVLADGFPVAFGFLVFPSINEISSPDYLIPVPEAEESPLGGHAVLAVGYDDRRQALKIRNSWGEEWGDKGYGWLPYDYVTAGGAMDFWTVLSQEWVGI